MLINASSEHVTASSIYGSGDVDVNETACTIVFIGPVGPGNLTIGLAREDNSPSSAPAGWFPSSYVLPVHIQIVDPANKTIVEEDVTTPYFLAMDFKARGQYRVYLTNNGNESSPIPVGLQFEERNPKNIEADKLLLAALLVIIGIVLVFTGVIIKRLEKGNFL